MFTAILLFGYYLVIILTSNKAWSTSVLFTTLKRSLSMCLACIYPIPIHTSMMMMMNGVRADGSPPPLIIIIIVIIIDIIVVFVVVVAVTNSCLMGLNSSFTMHISEKV